MSTRSIVWKAITAWMLWRAQARLRRAIPALVALDTAQAETRRQHRSGAREIALQRKRLVTERLRMELGV